MTFKKIFPVLMLTLCVTAGVFSQDLKIGYANIEIVLALMPETKAMNQEVQTFQQKLAEKLQTKQQYAQAKYADYQEMKQKGSPDDAAALETLEKDLITLDGELSKEATDADKKLMEKRQALLQPILEKVEAALKSLAEAEGYDYILNSVDGNGVSIVLYGPEEHDLTRKLMQNLGIEIPENN